MESTERKVTIEEETTTYNGVDVVKYWVHCSTMFMPELFKTEEDAIKRAKELRDRKTTTETIDF